MSEDEDYGLSEYIDKILQKFRREFDRVFQLTDLSPELSWDIEEGCMEPLFQIQERENEIIVSADLPLVKKESIKIKADVQSVEITAETAREIVYDKWWAAQHRKSFCRFHKKIMLPAKIIPEKAKAKFKNGILILTLPKKKQVFEIKID